MTRKERKRKRKHKPIKWKDNLLWKIARQLTRQAVVKNFNIFDGTGCMGASGSKVYCESCYYKPGCLKRR